MTSKIVITPYTIQGAQKKYVQKVGFEADLLTGGWEGQYVDFSLLDLGRVTATASVAPGGYQEIEFLASVWSPSLELNILGVKVEIGGEILAIGGGTSTGYQSFGFSLALGLGFSFSVDWSEMQLE